MSDPGTPTVLDGGDLACGQLLLRLVATIKQVQPGSLVRLIATDPAAPLDVPSWCHLTRHVYRGSGRGLDGRPHYDIEISADAATTKPGRPWHLTHDAPDTPNHWTGDLSAAHSLNGKARS